MEWKLLYLFLGNTTVHISERACWEFHVDCIESIDHFGVHNILTILDFLVPEHKVLLYWSV